MSTSDTAPLFGGRDGAILERSWAGQRGGFERDPVLAGEASGSSRKEGWWVTVAVPAVRRAVRARGPGAAALRSRALPQPLTESLSGPDRRPRGLQDWVDNIQF